jgi:hypothetical protein
MDPELIKTISTIIFFVVIVILGLTSLMSVYVLNRYGQKKSITLIVSLAFGAVFFLGTLSAFLSLQKLF